MTGIVLSALPIILVHLQIRFEEGTNIRPIFQMRKQRLRSGQSSGPTSSACQVSKENVRPHPCAFPHPDILILGLGDLGPSSHHSTGNPEVGSGPRQPDNPLVAFSLLVFLALGHLPCLCGGQKHPDNSIFTGALQTPASPHPPAPQAQLS